MMKDSCESVYFTVRDGLKLAASIIYAQEPNDSSFYLLFIHGGSFNSKRYVGFAKSLRQSNITSILLDLRGHGSSEGPRGNTHYIGQLEDDLCDVMHELSRIYPNKKFLIGGHSSGGAVVLRYAKKYGFQQVVGCLLIAPAMTAIEISRYNQKSHRILYLLNYYRSMLNFNPIPKQLLNQIPKVDYLKALLAKIIPFYRENLSIVEFPGDPKIAAIENRTLKYTYNMMASISLQNYQEALQAISYPTLFIIGSKDEVIDPAALKTAVIWNTFPFGQIKVKEIPDANHLTICKQSAATIDEWIKRVFI